MTFERSEWVIKKKTDNILGLIVLEQKLGTGATKLVIQSDMTFSSGFVSHTKVMCSPNISAITKFQRKLKIPYFNNFNVDSINNINVKTN